MQLMQLLQLCVRLGQPQLRLFDTGGESFLAGRVLLLGGLLLQTR